MEHQKIINARLRAAVRAGELPFVFEDEYEKNYRKIVWKLGVEIGRKLSVNKKGDKWVINYKQFKNIK